MTKVLLVDDHAGFLAAATAVCNATPGIQLIGTATNGTDAEAYAESREPDLILVDVRLAGEDGVALAERLRQLVPSADVVVCSTLAHDDLPTSALAGHHFFQKDNFSVRSLTALAARCVA